MNVREWARRASLRTAANDSEAARKSIASESSPGITVFRPASAAMQQVSSRAASASPPSASPRARLGAMRESLRRVVLSREAARARHGGSGDERANEQP
jgi:hypothetical protein